MTYLDLLFLDSLGALEFRKGEGVEVPTKEEADVYPGQAPLIG